MTPYNGSACPLPSRSVQESQIRFLYQVPQRVLVNAVNAVIVAAVLWGAVSAPLLACWLAAVSLIAIIRYVISKRFNRNPPSGTGIDRAARLYSLGSLASGILWGVAVAVIWLIPDMFQQVFVAFVVGGMCAAVAGLNSYHLPTVNAFTFTASAPWIVGLLIKGDPTYLALAVMWVVFVLFLTVHARMSNAILLKSLRLQEENAALVSDLSKSRDTLEERVRDRTAELEATNMALQEEMKAHAETERHLQQAQKMEAIGQLTGGIAHDFNNLLAVIQGNSELLSETEAGNTPMVQAIIRATDRGAHLTQRLLAFSRRQPLRPQTIDLAALVADMSNMLQRTLGETIKIETKAAQNQWTAFADPVQVENALLNLAINARDAMPNGGKLIIECANTNIDSTPGADLPELSAGDYAVLCVTDTGNGISEDVLQHVFEPFYTTKEIGQGSGLGLSMVHGFASQSGGNVKIFSTTNSGTTVSLYLPRGSDTKQFPKENTDTEERLGGTGTILVVEDDPDVRLLTVMMLENLGYRVFEASQTTEARAILARETKIDLMLSDVILPGGQSGPDFAKEAAENYPNLKIIFMSGYPATVSGGPRDLSVDRELLQKPFEMSQLAEVVRNALNSEL